MATRGRVREIREDLHAHAEIRYQEHRTAKVCADDELERLGIGIRPGVAVLAWTGRARGPRHGGLQGRDGRAARYVRHYESVNPGAAHLCGHDGHVAALLGAAQVLSELRDVIPGNVKFLFEPAEEMTPPGEKMGAKAMIDDGALEDPEPIAVFGSHFYPDWPAGSVALRAGPAFAGNDSVRLTITAASRTWLRRTTASTP